MEVKDLFTEELRQALPERHSLTRKRTVRLADLAQKSRSLFLCLTQKGLI
jgi:hypothetical protein